MGIPRFYRWLKGRFPMIRFDLSDKNKQIPIFDHFYIDFNALVYQCIRESNCFLRNKIKPLTFEQIYERVFVYLQELIEVVNPRDMIFIAFDGVAPRAKINQSRDRRFKSSSEQQVFEKVVQQIGVQNKQFFQQNSISPGTQFLYDLCINLKERIIKEMQQNWKHLKIFFSDCCVPGEGEHKIMQFLRYTTNNSIFTKNTTYCVYSPDADVILLTLSLGLENICLIKQDTSGPMGPGWTATTVYRKSQPKQFEFVMINILREYFQKEFEQILRQVKGSTIQQIIDDLILLMAFVGNDFLPLEFCFTLKDGHIENLFASYKSYLKENKQFINKRGKIDWQNVYKLLQIGKRFQAKMIDEMLKQKRGRKTKNFVDNVGGNGKNGTNGNNKNPNNQNGDQDIPEDIQNFQVQNQSITKGRDKYYKTRFNIDDIKTDPKYEQIIKSYIEGLEFYCEYYFIGLPSWTWFYPYHYTPMLTDVYQYLKNKKVNVQFKPSEPFEPFLALMFMVSLKSAILLPKPIQNILNDENGILRQPIDYFPTQFQLDKFQSLKYNKRAIIQFLEQDLVRKAYLSVAKTAYTKQQLLRNQRKHVLLFTYSPKSIVQQQLQLHHLLIRSQLSVQIQKKIQEQLRQLFKGLNKQKDAITRDRFPSLKIWGNNFELQEGKIVTKNKYKYSGNPGQIVFFNNFLGIIEDADSSNLELKNIIQLEYAKNGVVGKCDFIFTIKRVTFTRQINRFCLTPSRRQVLVPDFAVFKPPNYDYIRKTEISPSQQHYQKGETVAILNSKYFGYQGVIQSIDEKKAQVHLTRAPIHSEEKVVQFQSQFYTVDYVLDHLNIKYETLIAIMDEIVILPQMNKKKQPQTDFMPTAINFSLNIIDVTQKLIVPRFVRCQMEYENTRKPQEIFKKMEISQLGLKNLELYLEKFEWLIEHIEQAVQDRSFVFRRPLYAREIFGDFQKPNIQMYKEFVKLYDFDNEGSFYSIYSKVYQTIPEFTSLPFEPATITVRHNEMISRRQGKIAPPALKYEPEYHNIGDKVILLRNLETGYIVGIDDHMIHVRTLNKSRHYRVKFHELFNEHWSGFLAVQQGKTWNLDCSYFSPTFWKKAIDLEKGEDDGESDFD